uniref:Serine/threonine-protein kinase SAK n=1 Tax=Cacopsylla melanoneura TaxID=428564 RepID=A0A8D9EUT2_9HEMI
MFLYDYEIQEQIGKGGFATVFRAKNYKKNQNVAVKVINWQLMKERKFEEKVLQEIEIHSKLCHPNVIKLLDHFSYGDNIYLVLELCENDTVKRYLDENGKLSEREARDLLEQIVQGLLYLQSQNIVHRDIKPDNLLLTKDMQVKIADFGLATQLTTPDDKHMTMCGTPNYISPEVATRSSHGLEADCWALGCILYTLLVGSPPFDSGSAKNTVTQVVMKNPKVPSHVSRSASELIQNLLQKDPTRRMKLNDVLRHPFMCTYTSRGRSSSSSSLNKKLSPHQDTKDSGMGTNSFSRDSSPLINSYNYQRSRSVDRFGQQIPERIERRDNYTIKSKYQQEIPYNNHLPTKFDRHYLHSDENRSPNVGQQCYRSRDNSRTRGNDHPTSGSNRSRDEDSLIPGGPGPTIPPYNPVYPNSPPIPGGIALNPACLAWCNEIQAEMQGGSTAGHSKRSGGGSGGPPVERIDVPPLSSERLAATRHRTKNAVLSILEGSGEVCIEFVKKRSGEERVMEVCRISSDGLRVALYSPGGIGSRGIPILECPPPLPHGGADLIFSYESLPRAHWKKYMYAARFVGLVRAKTPKITLYSARAKCILMENGPDPDFEAAFYKGCKLTKSGSVIKYVDVNMRSSSFDLEQADDTMDKNSETQDLWAHFKLCHKYCLDADSTMSNLEFPFANDPVRNSCFPLILGKRPSTTSSSTVSSPTHHGVLPSFNISSGTSMMSRYDKKRSNVDMCNNQYLARVEVPNIGIAQQSPNGGILVRYLDGSELWIAGESDKAGIVWTSRDGNKTEYNIDERHLLTSQVRRKLSEIPYIAKLLAEAYSKHLAGIVT